MGRVVGLCKVSRPEISAAITRLWYSSTCVIRGNLLSLIQTSFYKAIFPGCCFCGAWA